ncbi:MAG: SDR family oxidoreductase, partial [Steroidobacteraceae bacterium]
MLEEAPAHPAPAERRPHQLVVVSARSEAALDSASTRLAAYLEVHPESDLADVAFTLHVGRRGFRHRRILVAASDDRGGVAALLREPQRLAAAVAAAERPVVFMFPGQGAQYPGMAVGLYKTEPVVRKAIDRCARLLKPIVGADLRRLLFPGRRRHKEAAEALKDTRWAQPALFTVAYAVAKLWKSWGIQPAAMIGHSVGEYVAATLANVMSLEDAVGIIARRGRLISELPRGAMLAVMAPADAVARFVDDDISLAAVNAPGLSVLSGPGGAVDRVEAALVRESIAARRLHTSHAFHSFMMEPILGEFAEIIASVRLSSPLVPFVATLTGEWADGMVTQPRYWTAQLRSTVRFADGVRSLITGKTAAGKDSIFLEVGPGNTLATFAAENTRSMGVESLCLTSLPGPNDKRADTETLLNGLGRLWAHGVKVDWESFHGTERRIRIGLPTYPFERRSYWIGARPEQAAQVKHETRDTSDWFHRPTWRAAEPADANTAVLRDRRVLVLDEQSGVGAKLLERLRALGAQPVVLRQGDGFRRVSDDEYALDPSKADDFLQLAAKVCAHGERLAGVVDCWSAAPPGATDLDVAAVVTLLAPIRLAHALSARPTVRPLPMLLVARGTARVNESDLLDPPRALGRGSARVLPQEHPGLRIAHVDVDADPSVTELVLAELAAGAPEPALAVRGGRRFVETFEPVVIRSAGAPLNLPEHPVVMITGGLGHMGMSLAEAAYARMDARLVLVGRTALPAPSEWAAKSEDPATSRELRELLKRLAQMRAQREELLVVNADFNDFGQVNAAVDTAVAHFGRIDLVVHGAARIDAAAFASVADTGPAVVEAQFSPKLRGLYHLMKALRGREPSRWVLHSSISSVLGGLGLAVYSGANAMLDVLALASGENWLSID